MAPQATIASRIAIAANRVARRGGVLMLVAKAAVPEKARRTLHRTSGWPRCARASRPDMTSRYLSDSYCTHDGPGSDGIYFPSPPFTSALNPDPQIQHPARPRGI